MTDPSEDGRATARPWDDDAPLVFVTVGTDHHPFDRLITWVDDWLATREGGRVRCVVQSGTSRPPTRADHHEYLGYGEMESLVEEASVAVCHGGPGSVRLCRQARKRPIVVPRRHDLGEHIDDHQIVFARRMAGQGELALAEDEATFRRLLEEGLLAEDDPEPTGEQAAYLETVSRFADMVDRLVGQPRSSSQEADAIRVLYVGGWGRSGSTLVDRVLGQVPGVVSLGEIRELWQRGWVENRPCGCGQAFADCSFWTQVGERAYGGWKSLDRDEVLGLRYSLDRAWSFPLLRSRRAPASFRRSLERYGELLGRLYAAIRDVSGARVIVDSSKLPMHAVILSRLRGVDLRLVHLVRDSRGVAHSWRKRQVSARSGAGELRYLEQYGALSASARYVLYNGMTGRVRKDGVPYLLVRYEDVLADPRGWVRRILAHAGLSAGDGDLAFIQDGTALLNPTHTVDGNPMRFAQGPVRLHLDDAWRQGMPTADRFWVTTLTTPLLRRYGYEKEPRP